GSLLVTTAGYDVNVYKSARNIERVAVSPAGDLNAYQVLSAGRLLVTKAALDKIRERATKAPPAESAPQAPAGKKSK
ncbi:MAG: 50S ribosomal protein L4, partial [Planctomycetaceae bacterium]|nr:50S ribosomal protein L4 [Planctomycetaceae bacterium]